MQDVKLIYLDTEEASGDSLEAYRGSLDSVEKYKLDLSKHKQWTNVIQEKMRDLQYETIHLSMANLKTKLSTHINSK